MNLYVYEEALQRMYKVFSIYLGYLSFFFLKTTFKKIKITKQTPQVGYEWL